MGQAGKGEEVIRGLSEALYGAYVHLVTRSLTTEWVEQSGRLSPS
jgi:hypothetical protein